jgi:hypothetical protein
MAVRVSGQVVLDYTGARDIDDILRNLSGAACVGNALWTVSDEGRTIECLIRSVEGFKQLA